MSCSIDREFRVVLSLSLFLLLPSLGQAAAFFYGLRAGTPLNGLASPGIAHAAATDRYTLGPALGVSFGRGFGAGVDLLYKRFELGPASSGTRASVHRLELPVLLRYEVPRLPLHPFVHAGISFNRVVSVGGADACRRGPFGEEVYCIGGLEAAELRHRRTHGPVLGIGLNFGLGRFHLAPELRITRWVDRNFGTRDTSPRSNLTQLDLLLGLMF